MRHIYFFDVLSNYAIWLPYNTIKTAAGSASEGPDFQDFVTRIYLRGILGSSLSSISMRFWEIFGHLLYWPKCRTTLYPNTFTLKTEHMNKKHLPKCITNNNEKRLWQYLLCIPWRARNFKGTNVTFWRDSHESFSLQRFNKRQTN